MHSIFKKGHPEAPVFVLLHGTGGDEHLSYQLLKN